MDRAADLEARIESLCTFLRAGWSIEQACPYSGLAPETVARWLERGRAADRAGYRNDPHLEIALRIERAQRLGRVAIDDREVASNRFPSESIDRSVTWTPPEPPYAFDVGHLDGWLKIPSPRAVPRTSGRQVAEPPRPNAPREPDDPITRTRDEPEPTPTDAILNEDHEGPDPRDALSALTVAILWILIALRVARIVGAITLRIVLGPFRLAFGIVRYLGTRWARGLRALRGGSAAMLGLDRLGADRVDLALSHALGSGSIGRDRQRIGSFGFEGRLRPQRE